MNNSNYTNLNMYDFISKCKIENNTFIIYNNINEYIVDKDVFIRFIKHNKPIRTNNLMQFIFNYELYKPNYNFINKNNFDLRKNNIKFINTYNKNYLFDINIELNKGFIIYKNYTNNENIIYTLDLEDFINLFNNINIINFKDTYPLIKYKHKTLLLNEYIFNKICKFKFNNLVFTFKNNDFYDLTKKNIEYKHYYHNTIIKKYPNALYIQGHYKENGKEAYIMKNPIWKIDNDLYLMYCEDENIIIVDNKSLSILNDYELINGKQTVYKNSVNYYLCNPSKLYIHQIITKCYGNGKGTKNISVDHIDRNTSNNCFTNLRIANRKTQELNSNGIKEGTKRARKKTAKELPEGITQNMLPKYVVYYKECYNKEKNLYREFFKIEKHPKIKKPINSSKSIKKTIKEKLDEIKKKLNEINNL